MNTETTHQPFPEITGAPLTRDEIIEGLRAIYDMAVKARRKEDPTFTRWPDMETMLDHIEEHGLPPKE